ncbi:MAG: DUF2442 domain-containing protein [Candidatus Competibacteraceae bacterium]
MKLTHFVHQEAYRFVLTFENGEVREADLQDLIGQYVPVDSLDTAQIDTEWGCLELLNGRVDIEPKTLYRYVCAAEDKRAA